MDVDNEIEKLRDEFPILKYKTYLNSAAHGPGLQRVRDAVEDYWGFRMREDVDVNFPDAKAEASKLIHASIDEICWCNRVTQGLNMVANMMEFETGENIVVTDLAYPSNVFVWLPFREQGVEIRRIRHKDGMIYVEDFEKAIDNKTRIVSISHIEWTCGILYDIKAISEMAHDNGALLVDDAYQAIGALEVNVKTDNIDFLVVGGEKWLCCPTLIGIFYIRRDLIDQFEPT